MSELDEELVSDLKVVENEKSNFGDDEQNIINAWIQKLSEKSGTDEGNVVRSEYVKTLARLVTKEKQLLPPFSTLPPDGDLIPLAEVGESRPTGAKPKKLTFQMKKMPCGKPTQAAASTARPTTNKVVKPETPAAEEKNVEDMEEMASVIAHSRGQTFSEFVAAISRFTMDSGRELRLAMRTEVNNFREYVDHIFSQRLKDITEVLDDEQNAELQKIKKDTDKWLLELSHCRKRIKEMAPDFDINLYRKDKNYVKKLFSLNTSTGAPEDDSFQKWKEESCHRLKWYSEMISKVTRCKDAIDQEIANTRSQTLDLQNTEGLKQQNHIEYINCQFAECQRLELERDRLQRENAELLSQLRGFE